MGKFTRGGQSGQTARLGVCTSSNLVRGTGAQHERIPTTASYQAAPFAIGKPGGAWPGHQPRRLPELCRVCSHVGYINARAKAKARCLVSSWSQMAADPGVRAFFSSCCPLLLSLPEFSPGREGAGGSRTLSKTKLPRLGSGFPWAGAQAPKTVSAESQHL